MGIIHDTGLQHLSVFFLEIDIISICLDLFCNKLSMTRVLKIVAILTEIL